MPVLCIVFRHNLFHIFLECCAFKGSGLVGVVAHSCFRFVPLHGREEGTAILARRALATEEIFD